MNGTDAKLDMVVTRIIDAPVEEVWRAWTMPEMMKQWWGPTGYISESSKIDLRVGGKYILQMRAPKEMGGQENFTSGVYKRIVPKELIESVHGLSDAEGNRIEPSQIGMGADFPNEVLQIVTLRKMKCDMTEMTITQKGWPYGQMYALSIAGWNQSIDKLCKILSK